MKIADNINHGRLGLSELMEIPPPPFGLIAKARFITPEPISKIARRLEELSKDPDDEYAWYPFEKFVISDYPPLIESQIELYDQLIAMYPLHKPHLPQDRQFVYRGISGEQFH
ncbi:hypothetical protein K5D58_23945, partial [Pseudomonas cichorii]|nr:hypothetical protein [Pseudomonas cichorii]